MIIVRLRGGLGNQLFQYAAARRLALLHRTEVKADLTQWRADGRTDRPILLGHFMAPLSLATPADMAQARPLHVREGSFTFHPAMLRMPDNILVDGYWQSESYFSDAAAIIRRDLAFRNPVLMEKARADADRVRSTHGRPLVAVHVRRGDYTWPGTRPAFHELSLGWYRHAMSLFPPHTNFLVFSDDPEWCRRNFSGERIEVMDTGSALSDFAMMRCCGHYIVANSTFSWWAAYLSENPKARIIAPDRNAWFGPRLADHDASHIIPPGWMTLPDPCPMAQEPA